MAAQAVLVLILSWRNRTDTIGGQYPIHGGLGGSNLWRIGECAANLLRTVRIVAVNARCMAAAAHQRRFGGIVRLGSRRKRMIGSLGELGVNVGQGRTDIVVAIVAGYTILGRSVHVGQQWRRAAQQTRRAIGIVLHMTA